MGDRLKESRRRISRDPMDDFEIHMHALGQVEDVLRLLRTFRDEGYSVDDVAATVRVVLQRIEHDG